LIGRGARVVLHDPHVRPEDQNLARTGLTGVFTRDFVEAVSGADGIVVCAAHAFYRREWSRIRGAFPGQPVVFDGSHLHTRAEQPDIPGLGKGRNDPPEELIGFAVESFRAVERGVALEIEAFVKFVNEAYPDPFNRLEFEEISRLAGTCVTGCRLVSPAPNDSVPEFRNLRLRWRKKPALSAARGNRSLSAPLPKPAAGLSYDSGQSLVLYEKARRRRLEAIPPISSV
jgi:hypothetical protein